MNNDLISRSALLEAIETDSNSIYNFSAAMHRHVFSKCAYAKDIVSNAPSVDAIEVVRCCNCKHWGTGYGGETENVKVCEYANYMVGKNGYCAYGEAKNE